MYEIRTVTPSNAADLLANNNINRKLDERLVKFYANEMAAGDWHLNGETIKIASTGELLDGQHRLNAVIKAGKPIDLEFITGIDISVMSTIDTGKSRSAADVLGMNGYKYPNHLAAASNLIIAYYADKIGRNRGRPDNKLSNEQILDFVRNHPGITKSAPIGSNKSLRRLLPASMTVAFHYIFSQFDENQANKFFADLESGAGMELDDPVLQLRNRLLESKMSMLKSKKLSKAEILGLIIKAWNYRRTGTKIKMLKMLSNENYQRVI